MCHSCNRIARGGIKTVLVLVGTLFVADPVWSQVEVYVAKDADHRGSEEILTHDRPTAVNTGKVALNMGVDFTTAYFFRGLLNEDQGVIVQPWAESTFSLYDGEGALSKFCFTLGIWNSIQDEKTLANATDQADAPGPDPGDDLDAWYEADLYTGFSVELGQQLTAAVVYTAYTSPSDAFLTIQEIAFGLAWDDSSVWKKDEGPGFNGFQPSVTVAVELDNSVAGPNEGVYLEFKLEPGFDGFMEIQGQSLTISFPMTVGLSLDDYYENSQGDDETFGYLDVGAVLGIPLTGLIPTDFGSWELAAGVHFLYMANHVEAVNHNDDIEIIGTVGVSMAY